jgi:four helix bundle protein
MGRKTYRELEVWQVAMELAEECYRVTSRFPKQEIYGLVSQIRRAAVSIAANIAEGQGRRYGATSCDTFRSRTDRSPRSKPTSS